MRSRWTSATQEMILLVHCRSWCNHALGGEHDAACVGTDVCAGRISVFVEEWMHQRNWNILCIYIYICAAVSMYIRTGRKSEHWCYKSK